MPEVEHNTLTSTALNVQTAMPTAAPSVANLAYVLNNANGKALLVSTGTASVNDWVVVAAQPTEYAGDPNGNVTALFPLQQIVDTATEPPKWYYALPSQVGSTDWTEQATGASGGLYSAPGTPELWINGQNGITESAFVISEIVDQSTSSNDLTYTSNTTPTVEAGAYNSLDAINIDNGISGQSITTTPSANWTIIVAAHCKSGEIVLINGDSGNNEIYLDAANNRIYYFIPGQVNSTAPGTTVSSGLAIYSIVMQSGDIKLYQNGTEFFSDTSTYSAFSWENAFTFVGGTGSPNTSLTDMLIYPSVLSASDHNALGQAIAGRYGLTWANVS